MEFKGLSPPKWVSRIGIWPHGQRNEIVKWFNELWGAVAKVQAHQFTLDPASVGPNTTIEESVTINGLTADDVPVVSKPSHTPGLGIVGARCGEGTLYITFMNTTGSPIDAGSETYTVTVQRR